MKIFSVLVLLSTVIFSGCVSRVDGHLRPGNPLSHDKVISQYECGADRLLNASRDVVKHNGELLSEDPKTGVIYAKIDRRDVYLKIQQVDDKVSQVTVQALNGMNSGDIQLASELNKQIAVRLVAGQ